MTTKKSAGKVKAEQTPIEAAAAVIALPVSVETGYRAQGLAKRLIGLKRGLESEERKKLEGLIVSLQSYRSKAAAAAAGQITAQWFCAVPKDGRVHGIGSYAKLK